MKFKCIVYSEVSAEDKDNSEVNADVPTADSILQEYEYNETRGTNIQEGMSLVFYLYVHYVLTFLLNYI